MNGTVGVSEQILNEIDNLMEKSGVSKETFLKHIADYYNMNFVLDKKINDLNAYYDSFTS
ncbi:hypothetical protein [Candidatus Clostridium stratigraminis]|uniref:Uncharacterized protein n=1 Tax=Candidatus Clostridium stratigraminis TaxID=3381661 RepID=A0ABW8T5D2_9CLOT